MRYEYEYDFGLRSTMRGENVTSNHQLHVTESEVCKLCTKYNTEYYLYVCTVRTVRTVLYSFCADMNCI